MLSMGQVAVVRHKLLVEGQSARKVARDMGLSRNTVRHYRSASEPARVETVPRRRPVLDAVRARIDALLEEWGPRTGGKQRITGTRVLRQLRTEGHRAGHTLVRAYLAERRRAAAEVFIPLVHRPGDEAQVDFFEVLVDVAGERRRAWLFLLRLMHSGRDFAWVYDRADQIAFLDGHVRAFEAMGGVPARIVYDNLKAAVRRLLRRGRVLAERFQALASHYAFEPCFARPGEGHDKGGVEARGAHLRTEHLVPIPCGASTAAIAHYLPALARKPQAVRQVAPELVAELGEPFARLWTLLTASHGDHEGARVLGAVVDHGEAAVADALAPLSITPPPTSVSSAPPTRRRRPSSTSLRRSVPSPSTPPPSPTTTSSSLPPIPSSR